MRFSLSRRGQRSRALVFIICQDEQGARSLPDSAIARSLTSVCSHPATTARRLSNSALILTEKCNTSRPIDREASQAGASTLTNSPMPTSQQVGKRPDFEETNMDSVLRVLAGEKRQRFFGHLRATEVLPDHHLIRVARASSQYPATLRAAALRHLVSRAPLEVTLGRPFSERRRLTRAHHGI